MQDITIHYVIDNIRVRLLILHSKLGIKLPLSPFRLRQMWYLNIVGGFILNMY